MSNVDKAKEALNITDEMLDALNKRGNIDILSRLSLPRNKIARFIVLEIIAFLISLFIFVSLFIAFYCFLLFRPHTPLFEEGDAFALIGAIFLAMICSLVCSIAFSVWVHVYMFKKFSVRRETKDG
jgi:hypothetical protein